MTTMNWFLYNLNDVIYFQLESLLYVFKVINPTSHKGWEPKKKNMTVLLIKVSRESIKEGISK